MQRNGGFSLRVAMKICHKKRKDIILGNEIFMEEVRNPLETIEERN